MQDMASSNHNMKHTEQASPSHFFAPSIAGNATPAFVSTVTPPPPTSNTATTTIPWKSKFKMPDIGVKVTKQTSATKARNPRDPNSSASSSTSTTSSFKTSRIAYKLGEIAIANDLAYIPRMADDALIGINPDSVHSRESYIQVHNAAMDFTRQLPRGVQPAFFNPATHMIVPLQDGQRSHTHTGIEQQQQQPAFAPDLLDLELMANKPQTVQGLTSTPAARDFDTVPTITRSASQRTPVFKAYQGRGTDVRQQQQTQAPKTRRQAKQQIGEMMIFNADTVQKSFPRIPTQLRPTERPSAPRTQLPHPNVNATGRDELFCQPPPTFQNYPAFDVMQTPVASPKQARSAATARNRQPPTFQSFPTFDVMQAPPCPPPTFQNFPTFDVMQANPRTAQQTATTASHTRQRSSTSITIDERARHLVRAKPFHPQTPSTWTSAPTHDEDMKVAQPSKPTSFQPPQRPMTPPLNFDDVKTFSPRKARIEPSQPASPQLRRTSKSQNRRIGVHRQKTSQEIWDEKYAIATVTATAASETQTAEQQRVAFAKAHNERLQAMNDEIKRDQQAREKVEFHKQHTERFKAMQDEIKADIRAAKATDATATTSRFRPVARTFHPDQNEHRLRTQTVPDRARDRDREGEVAANIQIADNNARLRQQQQQMRPTARTFHMDQVEHNLRSHTRTNESVQAVQAQVSPPTPSRRNTNTPTSATTPDSTHTYQRPTFRRWQPDPDARTFEMLTGAGAVAAGKRRGGSGRGENM